MRIRLFWPLLAVTVLVLVTKSFLLLPLSPLSLPSIFPLLPAPPALQIWLPSRPGHHSLLLVNPLPPSHLPLPAASRPFLHPENHPQPLLQQAPHLLLLHHQPPPTTTFGAPLPQQPLLTADPTTSAVLPTTSDHSSPPLTATCLPNLTAPYTSHHQPSPPFTLASLSLQFTTTTSPPLRPPTSGSAHPPSTHQPPYAGICASPLIVGLPPYLQPPSASTSSRTSQPPLLPPLAVLQCSGIPQQPILGCPQVPGSLQPVAGPPRTLA